MLVTQPQSGICTTDRAIFRLFPRLGGELAWADLIQSPTPVERLVDPESGHSLWLKRDDLSSSDYGGNKPRTLEVLFGEALGLGARSVFSTGAFGSNHAAATVIHAPRVGLDAGALLFPQPPCRDALENLRVIADRAAHLELLPHWSWLPWGMWQLRRRQVKAGLPTYIMPPGGATPLGALGYVSAALELAEQVARGELPVPDRVVVAVGSTCTAAGLLLGLHLAANRWGAFRVLGRSRPPLLHAVRVTPWPVTSGLRIAWLAWATSRLLAALLQEPDVEVPLRVLLRRLVVDGRELGLGYGYPTRAGSAARQHTLGERVALDTVYAEKSAAALLRELRAGQNGPMLYWATKSAAPLPVVPPRFREDLPGQVNRWIKRAAGSPG